jgi:hypothetical protein
MVFIVPFGGGQGNIVGGKMYPFRTSSADSSTTHFPIASSARNAKMTTPFTVFFIIARALQPPAAPHGAYRAAENRRRDS